MPTMPALRENGLMPRIHAVSRPARTFTGDFYFTHRHEQRVWIAVGDVAGKGLSAAIVMAMIQEELEHRIASCASAECDPARTVARLHEFLAPLLPRNRFATAALGWLDDDGTLTLVNAGHPPPIIIRRTGDLEEIGSTGPVGLLYYIEVDSHTGKYYVVDVSGAEITVDVQNAGSRRLAEGDAVALAWAVADSLALEG